VVWLRCCGWAGEVACFGASAFGVALRLPIGLADHDFWVLVGPRRIILRLGRLVIWGAQMLLFFDPCWFCGRWGWAFAYGMDFHHRGRAWAGSFLFLRKPYIGHGYRALFADCAFLFAV